MAIMTEKRTTRNSKFEGNIIIAISSMRNIMEIFFGPFLTAYFIQTSPESIVDLSIYYIFSYILLTVTSFVVASIIKNKFRIGMFRIGVILNFFYILSIIILKENIINYIPLVAILYGLSAGAYWFPYNMFAINKVDNNYRTEYTVKSKNISSIIGVLVPVVLGSIITVTNYEATAIIILIISIVQIVLSFLLSPENENELPRYDLIKTIRKIKNNSQIRKMSLVEFFIGMNISGGALGVLATILIINSFKTDLNLGIIASVTSIISILFVRIYGKIYKRRDDKNIILASCIIPVLSVILFLLFQNDATVIIYNVCFVTFTTILAVAREIRLFNISDSKIIDKQNQCEFLSLREGILNFGRVTGFIVLLLAGLSNNQLVLNITLIVLTLSIFITGLYCRKIDKFEK